MRIPHLSRNIEIANPLESIVRRTRLRKGRFDIALGTEDSEVEAVCSRKTELNCTPPSRKLCPICEDKSSRADALRSPVGLTTPERLAIVWHPQAAMRERASRSVVRVLLLVSPEKDA